MKTKVEHKEEHNGMPKTYEEMQAAMISSFKEGNKLMKLSFKTLTNLKRFINTEHFKKHFQLGVYYLKHGQKESKE